MIVLFNFCCQESQTTDPTKSLLLIYIHSTTAPTTPGPYCYHNALASAAAKEEAEQADKQQREAEAALKKEDEPKEGSGTQDSAVKPEDTVNTGSQSVVQVSAVTISWPL